MSSPMRLRAGPMRSAESAGRRLRAVAARVGPRVPCALVFTLLLAATLPAPAAAAGGAAPELLALQSGAGETVILLHGLGRDEGSMSALAEALASHGYAVRNLGYPSRDQDVESLARYVALEVEGCCTQQAAPVHFVTHSLGGILVRAYFADQRPAALGRVVMLAPPNQGSELVDGLRDNALFRWAAGPAASELGTDAEGAPRRLGPVDFELGVLTGDRSWNPLGSWLIPGNDDGTVAVESARVQGMADFRIVPATHTFIMRNPEVIAEVVHFLATGRFSPLPE
jgi:triacylglycerol lipase